MKIALCFYGCAPLETLRGKMKNQIKWDIPQQQWLKYVIEPNDNIDIFMHCWTPNVKEDYVKKFKPKKYVFEPPKKFPITRRQRIMDYNKTNDEIMQSVHYSIQQSLKLKQQYEIENNFVYNVVMIARMDVVWFEKVDFSQFNTNYIHIPPWNYAYDVNKYRPMDYILDYFIITNSELANKIGDLYNNIHKYYQYAAPQIAKYHYFKDVGLYDLVKRDAYKRFHSFILFRNLLIDAKRNYGEEWRGLEEQKKILFAKLLSKD